MNMCWGFSTVDQSHNMRMMETFEDFDFAVEIVFQLLVELR